MCQAGGEAAIYFPMKKLFLLILSILSLGNANAQTKDEVLELARRANNYFINKWHDPTDSVDFVTGHESNLWTRSVYYEGLLALYDQDPQDKYMAYLDKWGNFHKWGPYRSDYDTQDAD
jgi:hypothetical protein